MGKNTFYSININILSVSLLVKFLANSSQHLIGFTQLLGRGNFVIVSPLSGEVNLGH
jgi:hypothetical protein